jgi:hypothetical protein
MRPHGTARAPSQAMLLMLNEERFCPLLGPAGPWQKLAEIAEGCGNPDCSTPRNHPIAPINLAHEPATALTGTQAPATLPRPTQTPPTPFWLGRGISGSMLCSSDICYASPFKEKFVQTNPAPAESTTMFNETELASRWKISVRTLQDCKRSPSGVLLLV